MTSPEPETGAPVPDSDAADTGALDRSREAIDEGWVAAKDALDDDSPGDDLDVPATGTGLDEEHEEVTPRPN